jgi:hypothetical protein
MATVLLVDPTGQTYPALQLPEHAGEVSPELLPKVPGGHSVHPPTAPPTLYDPGGHCRQPVAKLGPRYCPGPHTSISHTYEAMKDPYTGKFAFSPAGCMQAQLSVLLAGLPGPQGPHPGLPQLRLDASVPSAQFQPAVATEPVLLPPIHVS